MSGEPRVPGNVHLLWQCPAAAHVAPLPQLSVSIAVEFPRKGISHPARLLPLWGGGHSGGMKGGWFARAPSNGSAKTIDLESGERRGDGGGGGGGGSGGSGGPAHRGGSPGRHAWGEEGDAPERHFDNHG